MDLDSISAILIRQGLAVIRQRYVFRNSSSRWYSADAEMDGWGRPTESLALHFTLEIRIDITITFISKNNHIPDYLPVMN
jgi:hypothetical protein